MTLAILFGIVLLAVVVISLVQSPYIKTTGEPKFCGGIAGITCPGGFTCKLDGNYPDAGGICIR